MGCTQTFNNFSKFDIKDFAENYSFYQNKENSQDKIYRHKSIGSKFVLVLKRVASHAYKEELINRMNFENDNILKLLGYSAIEQICGTQPDLITVYSEIFTNSLSFEIKKREELEVDYKK